MDEATGLPRPSLNPALYNAQIDPIQLSRNNLFLNTNNLMSQFDFNKNPITLKCRLYVVKALIYRGWDQSGKADPFLKIALNGETIIDDIKGKLQNTLEPVFGRFDTNEKENVKTKENSSI